VPGHNQLAELLAAERKAEALFAAIETQGLVRPGRTETDVDQDIYALAEQSFGVRKHWHKRIVRSGPNTVCVFAENPPVRTITEDDTAFLDLGPVFDEWEADVGRTYVMGSDPEKHRLCQDLPRIFDTIKQYFDDHRDVTGAELYAYAQQCAESAGCSVAQSPGTSSANFHMPGFLATRITTGSVQRIHNACATRTLPGR
jgi:hypothetical protein